MARIGGVYQNGQQINKEFVDEWFDTRKGARWKTPGSPRGRASLAYLGDDPEAYKELYQIKSKDKKSSWKALINLCKILTETPQDQLKENLPAVLDVEGALKFLALENVLINTDGYYTRTSDYYLYQDTDDKFHIIPHDVNESFTESHGRGPRGFGGPRGDRGRRGPGEEERPGRPQRPDEEAEERPGRPPQGEPGERGDRNERPPFGFPPGRGGPETGGVKLDPLVAAKDESKLLVYKLLSVNEWREQYLGYVREIADTWLDWKKLGPIAEELHGLMVEDVKATTRKAASNEAFLASLTKGETPAEEDSGNRRRRRPSMSLKEFADGRRAYLLEYKSTWNE